MAAVAVAARMSYAARPTRGAVFVVNVEGDDGEASASVGCVSAGIQGLLRLRMQGACWS